MATSSDDDSTHKKQTKNMATSSDDDIHGYVVDYTDMLGYGSFGFVYKATNKAGATVAVKIVSLRDHPRDIQNALNCLKLSAKHPNIIDIYDVLQDNNNIYVFMEYCKYGNLRTYFEKRELTTRMKVELMAQIADGIAHLHANDIIHRDVKPHNLLVQRREDGSPVVKIGDFGVSKFLEEDHPSTMSSDTGTIAYKAPEFWQRDREGRLQYKRSVDIFATGLTFLAMLRYDEDTKLAPGIEEAGSLDASEREQAIGYTMYVRVKNNQSVPNIISIEGDEMTKKVKILIKQMIHVVPADRVNAAQVCDTLRGFLQ